MAAKPMQSIYDLAGTLGVSPSTVSRVLNERDGIGEATRKRVLASARAAGFRPRMSARQVTIGIVIDRHRFNVYGGFVSSLVGSIVEELSKHDVSADLITEHNLERLSNRLLDGVLAMAWDDSTIRLLRRLKEVPVVTLNRMDVDEFSAVATDHREQGRMAAEYLAQRGHKRLTMICEERDNWGSQQRCEGFVAQLLSMGLPVDEFTVCYTDHQPMYGLLHRLLNLARPTAIFVANENLGLEATYILQNVLGVRVPRDLSLMGMESAKVSQFLSPPMTSLAQPLEELAAKSLNLLLQQVGNGGKPQRVVLHSRLIERESVAPVGMQ